MGKKSPSRTPPACSARYYDGIEFRGFAQTDVEDLAGNAGVPVWNSLTTGGIPPRCSPTSSPCRRTSTTTSKGKTLVFMGDAANNVARSLMVVCSSSA